MRNKLKFLFRKEAPQEATPQEDRFATWNESAKMVLVLAEKEAIRLKQSTISCEDILLGILSQEQSIAVQALELLAVNPVKTRDVLEQTISPSLELSQPLQLTANGKKALELAVDEARRMRHSFVDSGHILLGVMRVKEDMTAQFLTNMGVDTDQVRVMVWELLRPPSPARGKLKSWDLA